MTKIDTDVVTENLNRSTRLRDDVATRSRAIADSAMNENRALTDSEVRELTALREDGGRHEASIVEANRNLERARQHADLETRLASGEEFGLESDAGSSVSTTARPSSVLKRGESFEGWVRATNRPDKSQDGFDLGRAVRGAITGEWAGADIERRAMSEGVSANGGLAVPTIVSAQIIDRARNASRVLELGATVVPMTSNVQRVPRLNTDPTASWRNELAVIADSTPTLGSVDLTARSLGCLVRFSTELLEDVPGLGEFLMSVIAEAMAVEVDRAALLGSGAAPEPRGLRNTAGINVVSMGINGATPTSYANVLSAVGAVRAVNFEPTGILASARTATTFDGLVDTTQQPLQVPAAVAAIPKAWTNQIPNNLTAGTSTDCSELYTGAWDQLVIGLRSGLTLRMLDQRYADSGEVAMVATLRADVAVVRPAAFAILAGIRP